MDLSKRDAVFSSITCWLVIYGLEQLPHVFWHSYQPCGPYSTPISFQDVENAIVDLIDEACQILLPIGVCKQICHPHHIGTVNANYGIKGQKQDVKPGTRDNRYPEDVTFPPSDIEKVYDVMGDEDARKSKTMTLVSLDEGSLEEKPPKNSESDKRKPVIPSAARTPTNNPFQKQLSREILLTPKQSLKTANEGTRKTASVEQLVVAKKSREPVTPSSGGSSGGGRRSKKNWDEMGAFDEKKSKELPSREQISGGGGGGTADKRTPSRESNSKSKSKKALPPKMGTAEPI